MLIAIIGALIFGSVALAIVGLGRRSPTAIESRIQDFRSRAAVTAEEETDLSTPFGDRVVRPGIESVARMASSVLPASVLSNLDKQLVIAGSPMTLNAFVTLWVGCIVLMAGVVLSSVVVVGGAVGPQQAVVVLVFGSLGFMLPRFWLRSKVKARQKLIIKSMPDALDLVTTCVEAGLGLDAALARVAEKATGPLPDELSRMLRDVAMGKMRRDALRELGERCGVEELTSFVNSIIQAEQLGVGIAQVLRVQSDQLRVRRRQRAEQSAHEAPIKMVFPLVLFIFPAFMVVILGPGVIRISQSLVK
ncbi:MAG TPA: type II secretion system F family protein [Dehalococcoidia bacterium]|nr:type II secretion system F family protein [Dehalococcoidia bacterium]